MSKHCGGVQRRCPWSQGRNCNFESGPVWDSVVCCSGTPRGRPSPEVAGTNPKTGQVLFFLTGVCVFGASDVYFFDAALESHCGYGHAFFNRGFNQQFLFKDGSS